MLGSSPSCREGQALGDLKRSKTREQLEASEPHLTGSHKKPRAVQRRHLALAMSPEVETLSCPGNSSPTKAGPGVGEGVIQKYPKQRLEENNNRAGSTGHSYELIPAP